MKVPGGRRGVEVDVATAGGSVIAAVGWVGVATGGGSAVEEAGGRNHRNDGRSGLVKAICRPAKITLIRKAQAWFPPGPGLAS